MMQRRPLSRRKRRVRECGASMVEAALVAPLVFLLIFGILEGALLFRTYLSATNSVQGGSRMGSIVGSKSSGDYDVLQAVIRNAPGASSSQIDSVIVFNAGGPNGTPTSNCVTMAENGTGHGVSGQCNVYSHSDLSRPSTDFGAGSSWGGDRFWAPESRHLQESAGTDYLGVWVHMRCQCLSAEFFGVSPNLHATSVTRLEATKY